MEYRRTAAADPDHALMRLVWTDGAIADLEHIRRYVASVQPAAAGRLARRIEQAVAKLRDEPTDRRRAAGERPIVYPFVVRYRVLADRIVVTAIRHDERARIT